MSQARAAARPIRRLVVLCMLPLLALSTYLAVHHVRSEQQDLEREAHTVGKSLAAAVDQNLQARMAGLQMLATSPLIDDAKRHGELYQTAQGFRLSFNSHVVLADLDMRMLFNTRAPFGTQLPDLPRPKGHSAVQQALKTNAPAIGDVFAGPVAQQPLVAIALPVQRGGRTHLLVSPFETRQMEALLKAAPLPPGWAVSLRDGSEQLIARRGPALPEQEWQGAISYQFHSALGPWNTVLEIPRTVYRDHWLHTAVPLALGMLLALVCSLRAARWAGRRIAAEHLA